MEGINDHLYTPQQLVDTNNQVSWDANYEAFGAVEITTQTVVNNHRFPGQYYDVESGLYYNWNRYYDAGVGRYVTSDPIGLGGGLNTFGYAFQNPIINYDETGERVIRGGALLGTLFCARYPKICNEILKCFKNPKKCKNTFCKVGNKLYKPVCNVPGCKDGDSEANRSLKQGAAQTCLTLRVAAKRFCFNNKPDPGHDDEIKKARAKLQKCRQCP